MKTICSIPNCRYLVCLFALAMLITGLMPCASAGPADGDKVQESQCLPDSADSKSWPVKAIYLHGWYEPQGNAAFVQLERNNRKKLEDLARQGHYRIAIPVSKKFAGNGMRSWDRGQSLSEVEAAAGKACGGAPIAPKRTLIGFSAGGYAARKLGCNMGEASESHYMKVVVLGAPSGSTPSCRKPMMVYNDVHALGPELPGYLKHLSDGGSGGSVPHALVK